MATSRAVPPAAAAGREEITRDVLFRFGVALLRVGFGLVFLTNGLAKLPGLGNHIPPFKGFLIDYDGARSILASDTGGHPVEPYKRLVDDVILANFDLFGPLLTATEIAVGLALILGAFTPVFALIGFALLAHLQFANIHRGDKWLWEYAIEWMPVLTLACIRAGRFWGLDAWLARRFPRWPLT